MIRNKGLFYVFFLILISLIIFRSSCFFTGNSIRSFDQTVFYNFSANNNFIDSIFYVYPYASYFELWINIASKFATFFPNYSSHVDVYFALIIKLIIFFYISYSNSTLFYNAKYKILAISLILFSPPMTPEVWLTTIHSKSYFGIFTFILLFQSFENFNFFKKSIYRFFLVFNGFCSIYSTILSPIFFLKYLFEKKRDDLINFLFSLIPLFINFIIFIRFALLESSTNRFLFDLSKIENFAYNILIRPIFGSTIPKFIHNKLSIETGSLIIIAFFIIFIFLISILRNLYFNRDRASLLIISSFFLHSIFIFFGSLYSDFVGGRYAVIPGIILLTLFIRFFQIEQNYLFKYVLAFIIFSSLSVGLVEFKYLTPLPELLKCRI